MPASQEQTNPATQERMRTRLVLGVLGLGSCQAIAALLLWSRYCVANDPAMVFTAGYLQAPVLAWLVLALLWVINLGAWVRSWPGRLMLVTASIGTLVTAALWPICAGTPRR